MSTASKWRGTVSHTGQPKHGLQEPIHPGYPGADEVQGFRDIALQCRGDRGALGRVQRRERRGQYRLEHLTRLRQFLGKPLHIDERGAQVMGDHVGEVSELFVCCCHGGGAFQDALFQLVVGRL